MRAVAAGLFQNLAQAGRAGHIDFGEFAADDIQTGEDDSVRRQNRPDIFGDAALGVSQRNGAGGAAGVQIGAVVVGAAGRDDNYPFPANVPNVIAVANENPAIKVAPIRAPGTQVVSTVPGGAYDFFTGSSFSTAYVSGVVALIRQRKPHISASLVGELLQLTASDESGENATAVTRSTCPASMMPEPSI